MFEKNLIEIVAFKNNPWSALRIEYNETLLSLHVSTTEFDVPCKCDNNIDNSRYICYLFYACVHYFQYIYFT